MRISTIFTVSRLALAPALALWLAVLPACGSSNPVDADPFDTLQACYDEHHGGSESLPIQQAIVTCCLDHPIGGQKAPTCPRTQADCVTHVRAALAPSVLDADIAAACMIYVSQ